MTIVFMYIARAFDPPPIKEEKRLTGDQSEVKPADYKQQQSKDDKYAAIRKHCRLSRHDRT